MTSGTQLTYKYIWHFHHDGGMQQRRQKHQLCESMRSKAISIRSLSHGWHVWAQDGPKQLSSSYTLHSHSHSSFLLFLVLIWTNFMFARQTQPEPVPGVHFTPTVEMDFQRNHISQEPGQVFFSFFFFLQGLVKWAVCLTQDDCQWKAIALLNVK